MSSASIKLRNQILSTLLLSVSTSSRGAWMQSQYRFEATNLASGHILSNEPTLYTATTGAPKNTSSLKSSSATCSSSASSAKNVEIGTPEDRISAQRSHVKHLVHALSSNHPSRIAKLSTSKIHNVHLLRRQQRGTPAARLGPHSTLKTAHAK